MQPIGALKTKIPPSRAKHRACFPSSGHVTIFFRLLFFNLYAKSCSSIFEYLPIQYLKRFHQIPYGNFPPCFTRLFIDLKNYLLCFRLVHIRKLFWTGCSNFCYKNRQPFNVNSSRKLLTRSKDFQRIIAFYNRK